MKPPPLLWAPLMTPEQVSAFLRVPTTTLAVWRSTGRVQLPYLKVGGHVRYRREDVQAFLSGDQSGEAPPQAKLSSKANRGALTSRLEEFGPKHGGFTCESCHKEVLEPQARIVSHLELPLLEGPRDPHDWHCLCADCHQALTQQPDVLSTPKTSASRYPRLP